MAVAFEAKSVSTPICPRCGCAKVVFEGATPADLSAESRLKRSLFLSTDLELDGANCDEVGKFVEECALGWPNGRTPLRVARSKPLDLGTIRLFAHAKIRELVALNRKVLPAAAYSCSDIIFIS
jgi:hypothetical protein